MLVHGRNFPFYMQYITVYVNHLSSSQCFLMCGFLLILLSFFSYKRVDGYVCTHVCSKVIESDYRAVIWENLLLDLLFYIISYIMYL